MLRAFKVQLVLTTNRFVLSFSNQIASDGLLVLCVRDSGTRNEVAYMRCLCCIPYNSLFEDKTAELLKNKIDSRKVACSERTGPESLRVLIVLKSAAAKPVMNIHRRTTLNSVLGLSSLLLFRYTTLEDI